MKIVDVLTEKVYPDISNISTMPLNWFQEKAIISPTNEQLKDFIPSKFEASSQIYHLVDTIVHREEEVHYPTEFLNSLTPPRIQPAQINVKIGFPIILLRNLNSAKLCNGTKHKVVNLRNYFIEASILTGNGTGENVIVPRNPIIPSELPLQFKQLQFSIKLCY